MHLEDMITANARQGGSLHVYFDILPLAIVADLPMNYRDDTMAATGSIEEWNGDLVHQSDNGPERGVGGSIHDKCVGENTPAANNRIKHIQLRGNSLPPTDYDCTS